MLLKGSLIGWTQQRNESLSLKISQQEHPKPKKKEEKNERKMEKNIQKQKV
jgi:hypothetical protein